MQFNQTFNIKNNVSKCLTNKKSETNIHKFITNIHKCLTNVKRNQHTALTELADAQNQSIGGVFYEVKKRNLSKLRYVHQRNM